MNAADDGADWPDRPPSSGSAGSAPDGGLHPPEPASAATPLAEESAVAAEQSADGPVTAEGPLASAEEALAEESLPPGDISAIAQEQPAADPAPAAEARPRRRRRWGRLFAWAGGVTAFAVFAAAVAGYLTYRHLNANVREVNISSMVGSQPVNLHPQAENILVIGSDSRFGQAARYGNSAKLTTIQSDTLMIVHIAADRRWADIMSIPRDSWVNIPACRMGNGQMSSPTTFKINEAFALGNLYGNNTDLGVACTVKTLEKDTGIPIDHFVSINFAGFRDMVDALGGVPECNVTPINDPNSGLRLSPGHHLLDGTQALAYVRARYTLGNGSDIERISRQQAFMSSLVDTVRSKLLNPVAIYRFLDAATKSVSVDSQLGGLPGLYNLANSVRNMQPSQVTFFTLPTYPRSQVDPTDTANVMWTQPEDSLIFQAFRDDVPVSASLLHPRRAPRLSPSKVSMDVVNGTASYGLQDTVAATLQSDGFKVAATGAASSTTVTETVIRYHAGQQSAASLLAAKVPGAGLQEEPGTGRITLVLGGNFGTTANAGAPAAAPVPESSFAPRTASQNICT